MIKTDILSLAEDIRSVAGRVLSAETSKDLYRVVTKTRGLIGNVIHPLIKRQVRLINWNLILKAYTKNPLCTL